MILKNWLTVVAASAAIWAIQSQADWTDARCDVYPKRSDHTDKVIPCVFAQRQGAVTITRDDGLTHRLAPVGDGNKSSLPVQKSVLEDDCHDMLQ